MTEENPQKDTKPTPKKKKKKKTLGSAKGIETMFRNAYRAELDMISLAAMKANIMISLNGFIISALMISGAFLIVASPELLIPAGLFMLTSATSIFFALLAASPERVDFIKALGRWWKNMRKGKARIRDFRRFFLESRESETRKTRNLLIYEDRVRMAPKDYWNNMQDLLNNQEDVYFKMSDQLYWLGQMANRKFKLLNISYMIFRWGLLIAVAVFLLQKVMLSSFPSLSPGTEPRFSNFGISELRDIYEPSAVQQLPDGRILVVEDEAARAFSILTPKADGTLSENPAADLRLIRGARRKLNDLEALTIDDGGQIYAITSHSFNNDNEQIRSREQLLRFKIKGNNISDMVAVTDLRERLQADDALRSDIAERSGGKFDVDKLNIEGMTLDKRTGHLLLGLRNPRAADYSVILIIENTAEMFNQEAPPVFGKTILLDMGGGIRALSFDPVLQTFLIVNEVENEAGRKISQLWTWGGRQEDEPEPLTLPGIINLDNVESIDSVTVVGKQKLIIMSDNGSVKKQRPAKYLLLDYSQLEP